MLERGDGHAVDVGLDLRPERRARATPAGTHASDTHSCLTDDLQALPQVEADAFQHGARGVRPGVPRVESEEDSA